MSVRSEPTYTLPMPRGDALVVGGGRRALVMGILNVTPDSFSDGGRFLDPAAAAAHAEAMAAEGADVIDVGGESTRPGSDPVPPEEQIRRILPVMERLVGRLTVPLSVDTCSAAVARRALDAGAQIVNDTSALRDDPAMAALVAERRAVVVLMHRLGPPKTMQKDPVYGDVVRDVRAFLAERVEAAVHAGVARERIIVDPGFGFGKTLNHNLELLDRLAEFGDLGRPVLVGTSRKSMLGRILGVPPGETVFGTVATASAAMERGAALLRVHDVRAALHAAKVLAALHGRNGQ